METQDSEYESVDRYASEEPLPPARIMPVPEALAITNTTLSIAVAAFKACQSAYSLVQNIRNAPKQVQRLTNDVHGLYQVLGLLQAALEQDNVANARLPSQMIQDLEALLGTCTKLSRDIIVTLNPFVGLDGTVRGGTWRNLKWEMYKKNNVEVLQQTLETCKLTISMAVSSLNFITGSQTQKMIEQIRQDVAHLRTHADLQEDDFDDIEGSSTRAWASDDELSISSFALPLRRYLEETESLVDPESGSYRSESIAGSADDTRRLNPTFASGLSSEDEEPGLDKFRKMNLDSAAIDRAFIHALNTVKKIPRTGASRPSLSHRLQLYGFYKQAMEGDVDNVMDRPIGIGEEEEEDTIKKDQEKYDAWAAQKGLSRTEAKRMYINAMIGTMQEYASSTAEQRALLDELENVWDQVETNSTFPPRSYPVETIILAQ
ncbi:hypothetical protein L207DRAFT_579437 [Hyaloscypha variabilis F]|uniref:ACB domain-containing protein n=1 Tax=Hyaloscypha variabilis (strain UAMH 11265 / GT02V1 / F) TaxID=1149755 RepID=A0A2J6S196_HYAVF|nr:hypothetical protein L207DRAFT_579437 [Hyaloscypha variabilis F]